MASAHTSHTGPIDPAASEVPSESEATSTVLKIVCKRELALASDTVQEAAFTAARLAITAISYPLLREPSAE